MLSKNLLRVKYQAYIRMLMQYSFLYAFYGFINFPPIKFNSENLRSGHKLGSINFGKVQQISLAYMSMYIYMNICSRTIKKNSALILNTRSYMNNFW